MARHDCWLTLSGLYPPARQQVKAPVGMVQVTSPDQLVAGRQYRRYYLPQGLQKPDLLPTNQWAQDTRKFTFLGHDIGFKEDDTAHVYPSLFDVEVAPYRGQDGDVWNWCYLVEDACTPDKMPVSDTTVKTVCTAQEKTPMQRYRFDPEELFVLLNPAVQLLRDAEKPKPSINSRCMVQDLTSRAYYSRACGDWASAQNWYNERNPATDVDLYYHIGVTTVVQLHLLGVPWRTLRATLWQQVQPNVDLYLDRFLLVARYLFDNPDLMVACAKQCPRIWTYLVDHLEPVNVDDQWKRYAALRDIGLNTPKLGGVWAVKPGVPMPTSSREHYIEIKAPERPICDAEAKQPTCDKAKGVEFCGADFITYSASAPKPVVSVDTTGKKSNGLSFDGETFKPFPTPDKQPGHIYQFADGTVSIYHPGLTAAEEQNLEKMRGKFTKSSTRDGCVLTFTSKTGSVVDGSKASDKEQVILDSTPEIKVYSAPERHLYRMAPKEEQDYVDQHLVCPPVRQHQADCMMIQTELKTGVLPACPQCNTTSGYYMILGAKRATQWSLEVGCCCCEWTKTKQFTLRDSMDFSATVGAGYLWAWVQTAADLVYSASKSAKPSILNPLDELVQGQQNLDAKPAKLTTTGETIGNTVQIGRRTLTDHMTQMGQDFAQRYLKSTVEVGAGQPGTGVQWARCTDRALTAEEILELYQAMLTGTEVAVWHRITGKK